MTEWSTGTCETNGVTIHYTRTGGNKPPILLLHGLIANGACWTAVAHFLEGEYDIIMPDARGHGKSTAPDHGYLYEDHANDVIGLINCLHLPSVILIGHSMGGLVAALVASQHPKLLRGLILADPTFLSSQVQHEIYCSGVADQHRQYLNMSLEEIVAEARVKHPDRSSETNKLMAQARLQTSISAFDVLTPPNPNYLQVVSTIEVPSLLVIGGSTGVVSPEVAAKLQQINPRLQVEQIPDVGHGLHYDQPERFAVVVKSFLHSDAFH